MPEISKRRILETLLNGREALVTQGWIQGASRSPQGYCATGCVEELTRNPADETIQALWVEIWRRLWRALPTKGRRTGRPSLYSNLTDYGAQVVEWNDREGRTKDEVLALFDRAIANVKRKVSRRSSK